VDVFEKIDMRTRTFEIPPQEVTHGMRNLSLNIPQILTKDSVTVYVSAIMFYKVMKPVHAVANVDDFEGSARLLAATTLRNVLGTLNLGDILSQREIIARDMQVQI
jgi:erythrocyte band 7 integral membrane protein